MTGNDTTPITTLYTRNSIYDIDQEHRRIRRRAGVNLPLANQVRYAPDGDWASYAEVVLLPAGLLIVWGWDDTGDAPVLRRTLTSHIQSQDGPPIPADPQTADGYRRQDPASPSGTTDGDSHERTERI